MASLFDLWKEVQESVGELFGMAMTPELPEEGAAAVNADGTLEAEGVEVPNAPE